MIAHFDSYGFMQQMPRIRQFAEPDFMPWNNGWDPLINYSVQLDPTLDWGYQVAEEPYNGQQIIDPKPAACMALCREAVKELDDDFTLDDVVFLLEGSGYDAQHIRGSASFLCHKMGFRKVKNGRYGVTYLREPDYQI